MLKKRLFGMMVILVMVMLTFSFTGCGDGAGGGGGEDDGDSISLTLAAGDTLNEVVLSISAGWNFKSIYTEGDGDAMIGSFAGGLLDISSNTAGFGAIDIDIYRQSANKLVFRFMEHNINDSPITIFVKLNNDSDIVKAQLTTYLEIDTSNVADWSTATLSYNKNAAHIERIVPNDE